jgi:putative ABC transport system substrate-binding protein
MNRREFTLLGGAAAASWIAWSRVARAAAGSPRIGVLDINSAEYDADNLAAFRDGLRRLGYVVGRNIDIDYRHADGDMRTLTVMAQELVQLKPDVVLGSSTSPVIAVKRIAPTLPIVCPTFGEPFIPSLAASFARPGGSVTGIATNVEGLIGKLTELALDAIPGMSKIGFLSNPEGASMAQNEQQIQTTAKARGIEVRIEQVGKPEDFDAAFARLREARVHAVIVPGNGLLNSGHKRIVELALAARLPLIFSQRANVEAGGFASYGVNIAENHRRAATYVDKILKGTPPGEIPIEFPTKIELVVNLKSAKALGLTIPPTFLVRADEVIE